MRNFKQPLSLLGIVATLLVMLSAVVGTFYFNANSPAHAAGTTSISGYGTTSVKYLYEGETATGKAEGARFKCQAANASVRCYSPQQIRTAYEYNALLNKGITGKERTIVILDAFQSPTIRQDLKLFDQIFGIPNPTLNIIAPDGMVPYNPNNPAQNNFSGEITLDVEWAHAVAPGATIDLVLARNNSFFYIERALRYAVDHNLGDVISSSIEAGEDCSLAYVEATHDDIQKATAEHITVISISGDQGAAQFSQPPACGDHKPFYKDVSTFGSDPLVTCVGATQLDAKASNGAYVQEIALNETDINSIPYTFASGGGFSDVYQRPSYQDGVPGIAGYRGVPDVAYSGAINGGILVVWSSSAPPPFKPLIFIFGGTSVGAPQWAGITALADQEAGTRLGFLNQAIYRIGKSPFYSKVFHDITFGNNTFHTTDFSEVIPGYNTRKGWDPVTGWGTPRVSSLVPLLIAYVDPNDANGL